jgi:hypothetical protein
MVVFVLLVGLSIWFMIRVPGNSFLQGFATLLDRPEIVAGFINWSSNRSYLKSEFRGRKVVVLQQRRPGDHGRTYLVVSMETGAAATMESHDFAAYKPDRETELALFALEVKHELRLTHQEKCLKALWEPPFVLFFPGRFEPPKWQGVLEAMHTLAGSFERRAA